MWLNSKDRRARNLHLLHNYSKTYGVKRFHSEVEVFTPIYNFAKWILKRENSQFTWGSVQPFNYHFCMKLIFNWCSFLHIRSGDCLYSLQNAICDINSRGFIIFYANIAFYKLFERFKWLCTQIERGGRKNWDVFSVKNLFKIFFGEILLIKNICAIKTPKYIFHAIYRINKFHWNYHKKFKMVKYFRKIKILPINLNLNSNRSINIPTLVKSR
jgi:hypothetical protein